MPKLFDEDSEQEDDEDIKKLKTNVNYAKNYDEWRKKEELNKLKTKYGENVANDLMGNDDDDDDDSSSSSDDEGEEISEEFEKNFYKTLACLKKKDPKIYNKNVKFFDDSTVSKDESKSKPKKEKSMTLRDYEREVIVKKGGKLSDSEDEDGAVKKTQDPTYVEEQQALKDSFKNALKDDDDEEDCSFFKPKTKSEADQQKEEEAYKEWLKGQAKEIDEEEKKELKPLRDFWNDPNLDKDEKFLRDYVLQKKFLDNEETNVDLEYDKMIHDSDENLSEDERNIDKQEEFEHKYNFRFEEPDPEFTKRYPRTLEGTLRKKEPKRAQKRAEVKARKEQEKLKKREELKQLKALKRKEIEEKLEKLKEITGNDDIKLDMKDLEDDFDPNEYDKKMSQIFNDDYYANEVDEVKPEFPEIDKELEVEQNWDNYDPNSKEIEGYYPHYEEEVHCEDPEFNMDADYDGQKKMEDDNEESGKKRRRKKRSKFAEVILKDKPKFDPKLYPKAQEYFDQYYALDYEDKIGDLPCRFKYSEVVPNDYGLTVEEILLADDKELNKWCSLKRALQYKDDISEYSDKKKYKQKAENEALKRKVLPSLFRPLEEDDEENDENEKVDEENEAQKSSKKKRRGKRKAQESKEPSIEELLKQLSPEKSRSPAGHVDEVQNKKIKIKKKKKNKDDVKFDKEFSIKNKQQNGKRLLTKVTKGNNNINNEVLSKKQLRKELFKQKALKKLAEEEIKNNPLLQLKDERIKAYGIKNPKKFKAKLRYANKPRC